MKRHRINDDNLLKHKIFIDEQMMSHSMNNLSLNPKMDYEMLYNGDINDFSKMVPFPQKPKITGVIIEEIEQNKKSLYFSDELFSMQNSLGEILPREITNKFTSPNNSMALMLYKPIVPISPFVNDELDVDYETDFRTKCEGDVDME